MSQLTQFASGVYSELVALGVPADQIVGYFQALGISTTGWDKATTSVKQYAGYITAAADATGALLNQTQDTEKYAEDLATALDKVTPLPISVCPMHRMPLRLSTTTWCRTRTDAASQVSGSDRQEQGTECHHR